MEIVRVALSNFLNYASAHVEFESGVNMVVGENASGKTNIVDGVLFASIGRSSRHTKDKELINWNSKNGAQITLKIQKKFSSHIIDIVIDSAGTKHVSIDDLPIKRIGELMGVLNVVFFSPSELALISGAPSDRRRFLNISLSQQSRPYFYALQNYNKLLVQRNNILKKYNASDNIKDLLQLTDPGLSHEASIIIKERAKFIKKLALVSKEKHNILTGNKEDLDISYETCDLSFDNLEKSFGEALSNSFARDIHTEYTNVGPHRDDLKISANSTDLRRFGSQGQQRSAVLSMKLAEIELFKKRTQETPILILDDVLSELDEFRRRALLSSISGIQTLITCTEPSKEAEDPYALFKVHNCSISKYDSFYTV
ncbi:MAG: DNA replication/repair protein RecF [Christensenellaceae bacterium]|jgi:DNA replication and repair protein RecF|nr:DNA replication/repair protein RecF [Christensenellaceae bacterium]